MVNKTILAQQIAEKHEVSKAKASRIVNDIFDTVVTEVAKGETVCITGFGTFKAVERKATTGRNPQTGEAIKIKARKVPHFKAGTPFKETVKKKGKK